MTGELVRTSPQRLLVTLDGSEFDCFGGGDNRLVFLPEKPGWVLIVGKMHE